MKRLIVPLLAISTMALLAAVPMSATAYRGSLTVALKYGPKQFVLDTPASKILVVHNGTNIALRNGWAALNGRQYMDGTPAECIKFNTQGLGESCKFPIKLLKPGQSIGFKVTYLFTSKMFPNGVNPGFGVNYVTVFMGARDRAGVLGADVVFTNLYFVKPTG